MYRWKRTMQVERRQCVKYRQEVKWNRRDRRALWLACSKNLYLSIGMKTQGEVRESQPCTVAHLLRRSCMKMVQNGTKRKISKCFTAKSLILKQSKIYCKSWNYVVSWYEKAYFHYLKIDESWRMRWEWKRAWIKEEVFYSRRRWSESRETYWNNPTVERHGTSNDGKITEALSEEYSMFH